MVGDKLSLVRTTTATTYHFDVIDPGRHWALCTVNDSTGELQITSDWGEWAYRWHVQHLGPVSGTSEPLTRFLADPGHKHDHYLADKLTSSDRSKREAFDAAETVASLREHLVDCFKGGGLRRIVRGNIFASPLEPEGRDRRVEMTGREFAELYKALGELKNVDDQRDFVDRFEEIDGNESVSEEPWEHFCSSPTSAHLVLLHTIIPALVDACIARVRQLPPMPAAPVAQDAATS
jgi:hypothetical protein